MDEIFGMYINKIMCSGRRRLNMLTSLYNVTGKQARMLSFIYNASQNKEINQKDIEDEFNIRGASVTSILQTLEQKKLITRKSSKLDARKKIIRLSAKGEQVCFKIQTKLNEIEEIIGSNITPKEKEVLIGCFKKMLDNLNDNLNTEALNFNGEDDE